MLLFWLVLGPEKVDFLHFTAHQQLKIFSLSLCTSQCESLPWKGPPRSFLSLGQLIQLAWLIKKFGELETFLSSHWWMIQNTSLNGKTANDLNGFTAWENSQNFADCTHYRISFKKAFFTDRHFSQHSHFGLESSRTNWITFAAGSEFCFHFTDTTVAFFDTRRERRKKTSSSSSLHELFFWWCQRKSNLIKLINW